MPMFAYVAKDSAGNTKREVTESLNEQSLLEKLQADGYFVVSIQLAMQESRSKARVVITKEFTHNKVRLDDLLVLARQLATMLESGVTLMRSLSVISDQIESKELHRILLEIRTQVEQGRTLSSSLERYPRVFNSFWVSLVEVGEASGTMPMVLNKLALYSEREAAFRSTIISAMIYPAVLFFVCLGAICFFALFVAPRFESIFASMKVELPGITKTLLFVFKFVKAKLFLLVGVVAAIIFFIKQYIKTSQGQLVFENFLFHLPVFGEMYKLIIVERFASQMAILVESGVPILLALKIAERLVGNKTCGLIVANIREDVREGKLLADPMSKSGFFPTMAVQMIKVGEETGQLGQMLKHVSDFYQRNVEAFLKRFGTLIEPVMLVFMGGIIGVIVLAMFLPLFNMTGG